MAHWPRGRGDGVVADGVAEGVVVLSLVTQVKYTNTLLLSFTKEDVEVWVLLVELEIWNSMQCAARRGVPGLAGWPRNAAAASPPQLHRSVKLGRASCR